MLKPTDIEKSIVEFDRTLEVLKSRLARIAGHEASRPFRQELKKIISGMEKLGRLSRELHSQEAGEPPMPFLNGISGGLSGQAPEPQLKMVVVGDGEPFRMMLRMTFERGFRIREAMDGIQALEMVVSDPPSVVIASLILPDMSGMEMYRRMRSLPALSSLPILLLTGNSSDRSAKKSQSGGSGEKQRWKSMDKVAARVKQLLEERHLVEKSFPLPTEIGVNTLPLQKEREQNSSLFSSKNGDRGSSFAENTFFLPVLGSDPQFEKIMATLDQNLLYPGFSVASLSEILGMSRISLYKKVVALTGCSPSVLIRTARVIRAAWYLRETNAPVSEIAYKVGFSETRYFSRYFRDHYQMLPSTYQKSFHI